MLLSKTLCGASEYTPRLRIAYTSQVAGVVDHDRIAALCQDQGMGFRLLLHILSKSMLYRMRSKLNSTSSAYLLSIPYEQERDGYQ